MFRTKTYATLFRGACVVDDGRDVALTNCAKEKVLLSRGLTSFNPNKYGVVEYKQKRGRPTNIEDGEGR